jgi:hypothetical protein
VEYKVDEYMAQASRTAHRGGRVLGGPGGARQRRAEAAGRCVKAIGRRVAEAAKLQCWRWQQFKNEVFRVPRCWAHGEVLGAGYETVSTDEYTTLRSSVTDTFLGFGTEDYISVILLGTEEYKKTKEGTLFSCSVRCPFTKKLLDANWCVGANMTQTRERNKTPQESIESTICNGDYNSYMLVHMEGKEWMTFYNEDPSVEHCKLIFKKEFSLVIHRAKEKLVPDMKSWMENLN